MDTVLGGQVYVIHLFSRFWQLMSLYCVPCVGVNAVVQSTVCTLPHTHVSTQYAQCCS